MVLQVLLDRSLQFGDAFEHAAADTIGGDQAEEPLDLADPRGGGRREVQMEPLMALEPRPHLGVLVRGVVVGDQVHIKMLRRLGINPAQELEPLLVAMSRHALADHPAGGDVEGGEQGGDAMALIVVRHGTTAALLHGQARLGAIERLDLGLLVDREHQGVFAG